ncbi:MULTISPECIES: exodeoxyribonuclease V subunit gamma [Pseudoalteromonas]|uniref:exodeoxyribonuclease V subunit gamma n=1 Tax=Pseudoalteromonas TaxID=53246 RepID=UPI00235680FD|nr:MULTISPECIES: exodeoxyribonuclease V subunit gamma [Pseudoalteromonas]MDN3404793.1 exodeoxyribonuclease V subunit gamma [Pseudoalteromonas sp. APC 3218]MDN3407725.1 exodeoxyribonuclease V subunit gamma [Pseudoalteromonas sp. APC 3894]MDN3415364.1 exodeoxyribonuclease V subunit gamma [Pseudoalteromonas sp. APC 3227]MDN3419176.1 exodeoxyribonuclease V subunit gamma [Pseudoalteromonas sp. APC 3895]MDN3422431.1 exodeoxyribonuclease V subunit gamma [Pseudoalteromonas sp. APC 3896]|tara:strand:- start:21567 stop:24866 length:3300 start_codon:yes stop_codon:yes gene_type:complete
MLNIIQSNRMEALQAQFHQLLKVNPLQSPFDKEVVLVQSPGMSQWLKIGLSENLGVAAQVDFPLPSSFIWQLYQQLLPNVPKESAFNKPNLAWKLFAILPTCIDEPLFLPLKTYLEGDIDGQKTFALCEKIADVYDQYLMYRPHWIATWDSGVDTLDDVDISIAPWQPDLWRRLVKLSKTLGQSQFHRANMQGQLLSALESMDSSLLPKRISLFGISAIASSQLDVFEALSKKTEVFLFFFNPSEHYWGDIIDEKTAAKINAKYAKMPLVEAQQKKQTNPDEEYYFIGNPLLSSWGKLGRDYFEQLVQLDARWIDGFIDAFDDTLLGQVQSEIYQLAFKGESLTDNKEWFINDEGKLPISANDTSITLSDYHTPLREVERLHDYLLNLFNHNPTLTPKDIIVMMPDVGTYSPYIEAVFGGAQGSRFIPYALADLAIEQEKPVLGSFASLANLPFSRFGVSDILDLLQVTQIAEKFGLEAHEYEQIHYWLERVGVKWGINAEHKQSFDLPAIDLNTWQHGLNRLLLGIAMRDEQCPFNGIYSADEVEGMALDTLNKLVHFIDVLQDFKAKLTPDDTLSNKAHILSELLNAVYESESDDSWDLLVLQKVLEDIAKHHDNGDYSKAVSQRIVSYLIKQGIQEKGVGQRFLVGQVNFCTLMPMRAVPFKVVCMLGLNDADYPRTVQPIGFDLVPYSKKQKGDRSRKLDDRYLFLEALLSARDNLYMSYIGRSCFDNQPRMPSTLVSELLEYIGRSFKLSEPSDKPLPECLITQQHLQPFNSLYYSAPSDEQAGVNNHSYNPIWLPSEAIEPKAITALDVTPPELLDLDVFIRSVCHAQESFYQQSLGLRLPQFNDIAKDEEPFSLDALRRYFYLDEILEANINNTPLSTEQILQRGELPQANVGSLIYEGMQHRVDALAGQVKEQIKAGKSEPIEVLLALENTTIEGWLNHVYMQKQVFYRSASIKAKDLIKGFLYHLAAQSMEQEVETLLLGLDKQISFAPMSKANADLLLADWFELYKALRNAPVAFFPVSGYEYVKSGGDMAKANSKFSPQYIGRGEGENPYIRLTVQSLNDCQEEFIQWSEKLLAPLFEHAKESDYASA